MDIYDISGRKLNLSVCKQEIKVMVYLGNDIEELNIESAMGLADQGIDVFNPSDEFFNDICHYYNNKEGKDIIINDRRTDFYQNAAFCQGGCKYDGMDYNLMIANCICDSSIIQSDETNGNRRDENINSKNNDFKSLTKSFIANLYDFNFNVLKCSNLVTNLQILKKNIGFYCLAIMFLLQIIFLIIYMIKGLKGIKYYLFNIQSKNKKNNIPNPPRKNKNNKKNKVSLMEDDNNERFNIQNKDKVKNKFNKNYFQQIKDQQLILNFNKNKFYNKKKKLIENNKINNKSNNKELKDINSKEKLNKIIESKKPNKNKNKFINKKNKLHNIETKNYKKNNNKNKFMKKEIHLLSQTDEDLQDMEYEKAIIYDKRSFMRMYWSFLLESQIILGTFCTENYLYLFVIKLSFLICTFQISFFLNSLFYTDEYISDAYHNEGVLDFFTGLPKSIYSFIATFITTNLLKMFSNSKNELKKLIIEKGYNNNYRVLINIKLKKLRIKLIIYFILVFLLGAFFSYYVASFCSVYRNSQKYWFYGCIESFAMDSAISFVSCILLAILRYISIKKKIKCLYKTANFISNFL